jgi:hypothetical protein
MFKHEKNDVYLNGMKIPVKVFQTLEPEYTYPKDLVVMFYDGKRRNYRTKTQNWTIEGTWLQGDRYLARIEEFSNLMEEKAKNDAIDPLESTVKAKYPKEEKPDVKLQQRDDIKPKRTKGVRSESKRAPRSGDKHQRGAVGRSSE